MLKLVRGTYTSPSQEWFIPHDIKTVAAYDYTGEVILLRPLHFSGHDFEPEGSKSSTLLLQGVPLID